MKTLPACLAAALLGAAGQACAAGTPEKRQSIAAIQSAVEDYLRRETRGLPGSVSYTVAPIDSRLSFPACPALETLLAPGARLWGRSSVGVRCRGPSAWSIYIPVTVRVIAEYAVSARPLAQGETLDIDDLAILRGDLALQPAGVITSPQAALGRRLKVSLAAGQPLSQDMLRAQSVIQQGQAVRVLWRGKGFQVSAEGRAVGSAQDGQVVQVRMPSGQVIGGTARPGPVVEVASGG
jgi:flagellar basal body P-ring formation protein FlgA